MAITGYYLRTMSSGVSSSATSSEARTNASYQEGIHSYVPENYKHVLEENDCFSNVRKNVLLDLGSQANTMDSRVCVSIVWDACFLKELCGPTAVTETIEYLQKTVAS